MGLAIGFTGTRRGMTPHQAKCVRMLLDRGEIDLAHHGDCVGSDADFHAICREYHIPVIVHPPKDCKYRAFCADGVIRPPKPYPFRNRAIVQACGLLIATPAEAEEPPGTRGKGTWYTIRYARMVERRAIIIPPYPPTRGDEHDQPRQTT